VPNPLHMTGLSGAYASVTKGISKLLTCRTRAIYRRSAWNGGAVAHFLPVLCLWTLAISAIPSACRASTVIVPDDYPAIQTALGVGVDTILVRSGVPSEDLLILGQVTVIGLDPANRPAVDRVTI